MAICVNLRPAFTYMLIWTLILRFCSICRLTMRLCCCVCFVRKLAVLVDYFARTEVCVGLCASDWGLAISETVGWTMVRSVGRLQSSPGVLLFSTILFPVLYNLDSWPFFLNCCRLTTMSCFFLPVCNFGLSVLTRCVYHVGNHFSFSGEFTHDRYSYQQCEESLCPATYIKKPNPHRPQKVKTTYFKQNKKTF